MGLGFTSEIISKVAPARLFEAGVVDLHKISNILPDIVTGVKILEGDGGAGSIKQVFFVEGFPIDYLKERVDILDKEKLEVQYTIYEGGDYGKKLKSAVYVIKFVPLPDGGCVYKVTAEFNTMPGVELTEEELQTLKAQDAGLFRALEAYLLANPAAYA